MNECNAFPGSRYPLGANWDGNGTNFSIFSRNATDVELLLYRRQESPTPFMAVRLDPVVNRTFFFWHVYLEGIGPGTHYTWRVGGPDDIRESGNRFDRDRELLDPWARAVTAARVGSDQSLYATRPSGTIHARHGS